ncbi:MAG: hypothetical protein ACRCSI_08790 [Eubacterium aggregans]
MQEKCDLYFVDAIQCDHLRFVSIFDKQFIFDKEKKYSGYIGANILRIKALHLLRELKKLGVKCFLVPIDYRDKPNISRNAAFQIAVTYATSHGYGVTEKYDYVVDFAPLFWSFKIINDPDQRAGGVIWIDRLDGHRWGSDEYEEYMYDFNNILS